MRIPIPGKDGLYKDKSHCIAGMQWIFSRTGQILNIAFDRTPEKMLFDAIEETSQRCSGLQVVNYTSTESMHLEKISGMISSLQWRHNGRDGISNHLPHHSLLNRWFRRKSKKHQRSASLAFVRRIHRWPVNSPHKWPATRIMFPFDDVIMLAAGIFGGELRQTCSL